MTALAMSSLCVSRKAVPEYNGFVRIDVSTGDTFQSFDVHTALVTARSPLFKKALTGNWKEAEDRVVKLPEDEPGVFATYVHHLYTGELAVKHDGLELGNRLAAEYENLCRLYVLAEKLQDVQTKNSIVKTILETSRVMQSNNRTFSPGASTVRIIYNGTIPGSLARKLLVDFWSHRKTGGSIRNSKLPVEFLRDLLVNVMDKRQAAPDPTKLGTGSTYMEQKVKEET